MNITNPFQEISDRLERIEHCLNELKREELSHADPEGELPISISDCASITNLAVPTLYGLVHRRKIPSYRQGKRLYFLRSEILAWIKAGRRATIREMLDDNGESF
jgi:excisionase family DNA binding protein